MSELESLKRMREWAQQFCAMGKHDPLMFADEIQTEVDTRFMELPVDRHGETLRIGEKVWFHDDEGGADPHIVRGYGMNNGRGVNVFVNYADEGWCPSAVTMPDVLTHHKPRTLEDVLDELEGMRGNNAAYEDVVTRAAELAREIRELMEVDE